MAQEAKVSEIIAPARVSLSCPSGFRPSLKEGDVLGADWIVLGVQEGVVELAPMRLGSLTYEFECVSSGSREKMMGSFLVKKQEAQNPQGFGSLMPEKLSYDVWTWVALFLFLFLFLLIVLQMIQRKRFQKRKLSMGSTQFLKVLTPREAFEDLLRSVRVKKLFESQDEATLKDAYHRSYLCSRALVEEFFSMESSHESTNEFLAGLRIIAAKKGVSGELIKKIEALFLQADEVRFSGVLPDLKTRAQFEDLLGEIDRLCQKVPSIPPGKSQESR